MPNRLSRLLSVMTLITLLAISTVAAAPNRPEVAPSPPGQNGHAEQRINPVDINSASLQELRSLPGVGTVYSKKIVEGRPYQSIEDLRIKKVLPSATYMKIQDRIVVHEQ